MADKLEVLPGPGLVARFGDVAVWAGPQCSPALQAHLVSEAQKRALRRRPTGKLLHRSPAARRPGASGAFCNRRAWGKRPGPVPARACPGLDSGRWLAPQPVPGWMATSIGRPWPLIILPYGAAPPPQSQQGNPFDLLSGAVPGSGFVLLRPPPGPGQVSGTAAATGSSLTSPGGAQPGREREGRCPSADSLAMAPSRVELAPGRELRLRGLVVTGRCRVALGRANHDGGRARCARRHGGSLVPERLPIRARWASQGPAAERSTCAVSSPRCSRRSRSHRALRPRSAQTDRRCKGYVASSGISITLA